MSTPLLDLDLASIHLYLSVVDLGSISKAASRHGLSQPSASQRIRKLERQLGVVLLDRSSSGSSLTPVGIELAPACRTLVMAASDVSVEARERRTAIRLHTTVAAAPGAVRYLVPQICAEVADAETPLSVELTTATTVAACNLVRESEVDLALVDGPTEPLSLQSEVVAEQELVVVVGRRHRWAERKKRIPVSQLAAGRWVLPPQGTGTRDVIDDEFHNQGHPLPMKGNSEAEPADVQRAMVAVSRELASIVDRRDVVSDLEQGRLVEVRSTVAFRQPLRLAWSGRSPRSEGAQQFAAAARQLQQHRVQHG